MALSGSIAAQPDGVTTLMRFLPAESVAAYVSVPRTPSRGGPDVAGHARAPGTIDRAQRLGLLSALDPCARQWIDSLGAIGVLFDYPHAVGLIEISATSREGGSHRLATASAVLVADTRGDKERFARRIQHLLDTYTNSEHSELTVGSSGDVTWTTLRDTRLPDWVVLRWGRIGGHFVATVGDRAFELLRRTVFEGGPSLASDPWYAAAADRADARGASLVIYAYLTELRRRVDPGLGRKIGDVADALRLGTASRGLWVGRRSERALEVAAVVRHGAIDDFQTLAGRRFRTRLPGDVIPEEATRYAVVNGNPRSIVLGLAEAYLAARSPSAAAGSRAFWHSLQVKSGVSIEHDILAYLDDDIVWHDYPPAIIDSPLTRTMMVSIDRHAVTLRMKVGQLLSYVRDVLLPPGLLQLHRGEDGVWYVSYGLLGPSITVLDDWVVFGFSPSAVRAMRARLQSTENEPGKPEPENGKGAARPD